MQVLGNILEAMKSPEASPKEPPHGLTTTAGHAITAHHRPQPLTQNQLMAIASGVLESPLSITSIEKKIYGRKRFSDEFGEYFMDDQVIGSENVYQCVLQFKPEVSKVMLQSALMVSPAAACVKHLMHLALHKKFGSTDQDRTVLLNDYVKALCDFPEFVVHQICRHYWENDRRPFIPFISEMKQACEDFKSSLERLLAKLNRPLQPIIEKPQSAKVEAWQVPTAEEKAAVSRLVNQAIRNVFGQEDHP